MKKSTLSALYAFLNGDTSVDLTEARAEITAEYEKQAAKANAKAAEYEAAKPIVLAGLTSEPQTLAELYEAVKDNLPDGFTKSRMQYALMHYWGDVTLTVRVDGQPNAYIIKA